MTFAERASNAQETLFSCYDELNERLTKAEERLTSFHIPHCVSLEYRTAYEDESRPTDYWSFQIAIAKVKGAWRLCHGVSWHSDPNGPDFTPLVECSAIDRVNAARHIPKLEDRIIQAAEKFAVTVDEAVEALDQYLISAR